MPWLPSSGLFYEIQQGTQWFKTKEGNDEIYGLVGLLLGLAVYNGVVLDLHFPRCVSVPVWIRAKETVIDGRFVLIS